MDIRNIEVIVDNLENNPHCLHGPSLLFRRSSGKVKEYYACSASRDHKNCNFYLPLSEKEEKNSTDFWKKQQKEVVLAINKLKPYKKFLKLLNALKSNSNTDDEKTNSKRKKIKRGLKAGEFQASYCYTCNCLFECKESDKHSTCKILPKLTSHQLIHPTEILIPKIDNKTHAQYFFSKSSVNDICLLLERLRISKVLCIGVPRIHEHILNEYKNKMKTILLDFDKNYYNFYSKNQFIWYNMFNNHIFDGTQEKILSDFLKSDKILILIDPPFGGRVEPLARTLNKLNEHFLNVNSYDQKGTLKLEVFWFFPYFMEQHITGSLPEFKMFDYKVNYDNHSSYTDTGNRKRKFGSPVRIFTNVPLSRLDLNGVSGYKFCKPCDRWVSNENKHCSDCDGCTSKNGRTYVHCRKCSKCVKPSYQHCDTCSRCCLPTHICGEFQPDPNCYHCHQPGHKKTECPFLGERRKRNSEIPSKKRKKSQ